MEGTGSRRGGGASAIVEGAFAMKLLNERRPECSAYAIFPACRYDRRTRPGIVRQTGGGGEDENGIYEVYPSEICRPV